MAKIRLLSHAEKIGIQSRAMIMIFLATPWLIRGSLAQECGSQAGGAQCQDGYCCSNYGYCGNTNDYCGAGNCQSQCPSSPSTGECGSQGGGAQCQGGECCSIYGYCGNTNDYCGAGNCQSQCSGSSPSPPGGGGSGVSSIVTSSLFDQIFPNRNSFYTYNGFINAANSFPSFGTTGDSNAQKRDIAAFFAHVSHETSGLVYIREIDQSSDYCDPNASQYPCAANQAYYGRGPLQISWNYNYGPCGQAIGQDLLNNPDLVAQDATVSFQTALWFWTTQQPPKPSCHDDMDGTWTPSSSDVAGGRQSGFGVTIEIVNGGIECGNGPNDSATDRINFYTSISSTLGVDPGSNLECAYMQPF